MRAGKNSSHHHLFAVCWIALLREKRLPSNPSFPNEMQRWQRQRKQLSLGQNQWRNQNRLL